MDTLILVKPVEQKLSQTKLSIEEAHELKSEEPLPKKNLAPSE